MSDFCDFGVFCNLGDCCYICDFCNFCNFLGSVVFVMVRNLSAYSLRDKRNTSTNPSSKTSIRWAFPFVGRVRYVGNLQPEIFESHLDGSQACLNFGLSV